MGRLDWYRQTVWNDENRLAFHERLNRSRGSYHKAQYLRIQALYLKDAGYHDAAIQLLDELFEKYPDPSQLSSARSIRATCLLALGRISDVVGEYRLSLQAERDNPTVRSGSWLNFACLIAFHQLSELYDEALKVLEEFSATNVLIVPAQRFQYASARAFIADAKGDSEAASQFAKTALNEAAAGHSGFRCHPQFGLVKGMDERLERQLQKLAAIS